MPFWDLHTTLRKSKLNHSRISQNKECEMIQENVKILLRCQQCDTGRKSFLVLSNLMKISCFFQCSLKNPYFVHFQCSGHLHSHNSSLLHNALIDYSNIIIAVIAINFLMLERHSASNLHFLSFQEHTNYLFY